MDEITKIFSIRQIVSEELEKDIAKASSVLKTYIEVKKYIQEQVAVCRDVKKATKGPVQMDLNAVLAAFMTDEDKAEEDVACEPCYDGGEYAGDTKVDQLFSFLEGLKSKGGKGGGKYGGKAGGKFCENNGNFNGTCHHCGVYGHRINERCKKDAEGQKGKGKAKAKAQWRKGPLRAA